MLKWDGWDREIDSSRTVAKSLKQKKLLGASLFFKSGEGGRGNAIRLVPTNCKAVGAQIS